MRTKSKEKFNGSNGNIIYIYKKREIDRYVDIIYIHMYIYVYIYMHIYILKKKDC